MYNWFWTNHTDKFLHFAAGFVIYLIAIGIVKSIISAMSIVLAIAVGKELYDVVIKQSKFDILDAIATLLGGGVAEVIFYLLQRIN
jgi:hypothetical protein